ncbi:unnamed protein product [Chironomus riparius]|uniref:Uncharacterized protein n=1 Tax=Chironomus riparius TaxID=315576 RepID=A0A9N9S7Z6_9DIPT|nr:unnamed protein product [Chironomus riparius]
MSDIYSDNIKDEHELTIFNATMMQGFDHLPVDNEPETMQSNSDQAPSTDLNFIKWPKTFSNINNALLYIESREVENNLSNIKQALQILYTIEEPFEELNQQQLTKLSVIFNTKSVVIFFMSTDYKLMLIYWKTKDIDYFLSLAPPKKLTILECKEVYGFIADYLIHSLSKNHLGITHSLNHSAESNKTEINQLVDSDNLNILQLSAELGEIKCVRILLELGIFEDNPNEIFNASSLAWRNKHYDVLFMLIQGNFIYPPGIKSIELPEEIQQYIQVCEDLHDAVIVKNVIKIQEILKLNPNRRHFYNKNNESVLKIALEKKLHSMYELLLSNDISFGPHEHFARVFSGLNENDKTVLREIHFRCSKDLPEYHMNVLMMNTSISHDDMQKEGKEDLVLRAYRFLNKNPSLNPILKVVAASKRFNIIFDFKRNSVAAVDPTAPIDMRGFYRLNGNICVGAKQLLDPLTEHETFGTLAHELCHYAINLTFKNFAKPYAKTDQTSKEEFKKILQICKANQGYEEIIDFAFKESPSVHEAELIVRASHMIAFYDNQPEKLVELHTFYAELFNYYTEKVIPTMMEAIPSIRKKADVEIKEKDKKIFKLTRNFYIAIGLGILIAAMVGMFFYKPTYVFDELSAENQEKVRNSIVSYSNVSVQFKDLFGNGSIAYLKLTSDHITDMLGGVALNINDPLLHYLDDIVTFEWDGMHWELKKKFLQSYLNFQEQNITFKDLKEQSNESFNNLTSQQIINVFSGNKLIIGTKVVNDTDFYVERKFISEDAKSILFEYAYGHEYILKPNIREEHVRKRIEQHNKTFEEFTEDFLKQPFEIQRSILDKVEDNKAMQSGYYDSSHHNVTFMQRHVNEFLEKVKEDRILILSSEAGAGKTTTFKQLSVLIKNKFPVTWVSYVDLKNHTELYGKKLSTEELLLNILRLSDENSFEKGVFKELFKTGKVVFLWNGFDEISPTHNEFIVNLILNIHRTTNVTQFVCTRPLYSKQLVDTFRVHAWQLVAFNDKDKENFLQQFFILKNTTEEFVVKAIAEVKEVVVKLSFDHFMFRVFNTPLMLKLIAETYENEMMLKLQNTYAIYETFVQKKVEIWLDRGRMSQKVVGKMISKGTKFNIIKIFQKYAFLNELNLFSMCTIGIKLNKLQIMQEDIPDYLPFEEISGMGILYINGKNKFEFAHKTFAEFFIAQYFIENIYNADKDVTKDEAELRLELFFKMTKDFGEKQDIITNFMSDFLNIQEERMDEKFAPAISKLLRTKFRKFLFRLLDTNFPKVYEFLFDFFKKDYSLLVDLLHVNEAKTLYTAIFDPNSFSLFTNPKGFRQMSNYLLQSKDCNNMINGRNQKGVIMYGIYVYDKIEEASHQNVSKFHSEILNGQVENLSFSFFLDFFETLLEDLTEAEKKEVLLVAVNPQAYLYYEKIPNFITDFSSFKCDYLKLWNSLKNILSKSELIAAISNALIQFNGISPYLKQGSQECLDFLLDFTKSQNFSSLEIYEMFSTNNILHDSHDYAYAFESFWYFLSNYTTRDQRRDILKQLDEDDNNFYFTSMISDFKIKISRYKYRYYHYDFMPFNVFQKALTILDGPTLNFTFDIYNNHFTKKELQKIITSSVELPYYVIVLTLLEPCKIFVDYLEKLFEDEEMLLLEYFDTKIPPTSMSALGLVESYIGIPRASSFWFENLEIFTDFYKKLKKKLSKKLN